MKTIKVIGILLWLIARPSVLLELRKDGASEEELESFENWEEPQPGWLITFFQIFFNPDSDVAEDVCPGYMLPIFRIQPPG
ncbi:MAG: hypothetical protein WC217_02215 [Candidatus Paceibacterota bacterium]|jgi:hypothetical protein